MDATHRTLNTPEAYQAIGKGVVTLMFTHNLDEAVNAMLDEGRRNGSLVAVQAAGIADALQAIADFLGGKK